MGTAEVLWFDRNELEISSAVNCREDARRFKETNFYNNFEIVQTLF